MGHYAYVKDGLVTTVIVAQWSFIDAGKAGGVKKNWIKTSYNTRGGKHYSPNSNNEDNQAPLRKNFAGKGMIYDLSRDAFYAPQPYPSWALDEETCIWMPPVAFPNDGKMYDWNEGTKVWDARTD